MSPQCLVEKMTAGVYVEHVMRAVRAYYDRPLKKSGKIPSVCYLGNESYLDHFNSLFVKRGDALVTSLAPGALYVDCLRCWFSRHPWQWDFITRCPVSSPR